MENCNEYRMNMLNEKLAERSSELLECNLFSKIGNEEQNEYKKLFKDNIEELSRSIECILHGENSKNRIFVKYKDANYNDMSPQASSNLLSGEYIGEVIINIGLLIHLYEMFFKLNYKIFVPDGKNIDNIRKMLFCMAVNIILCHEVAHIYYRHGLLKEELINKLGKDSYEYKLDMQTLEYDADAFAITKMYEHLNALSENQSMVEKLNYSIFVFSIHAIIYLFRQVDECDKITSHPTFYVREKAMLKIVNDLFIGYESKDYIDFAEREFNRQFKTDSEVINSYYESMNNFEIQLSDIEKNYDSLKNDISRFSLLPVQGIDYKDYKKI